MFDRESKVKELVKPDIIDDVKCAILSHQKSLDRYDRLLNWVRGTVLDVGCGQGYLACLLALEHSTTAVDLHEQYLERTREVAAVNQASIQLVQGDIYELPFDDGEFDTVVCSEVLEHLEQPGDAARELARVGRNICISVPGYGKLRSCAGHIQDFRRRDLKRLVGEHVAVKRCFTRGDYTYLRGTSRR